MPRSAATLFVEDEPILKFEESNGSGHQTATNGAYLNVDHSFHHQDDDPYSSLKNKQEQLLKLRQELERTERETNQLEAQRRKEERFGTGRHEMIEKFSRSLVRLERELYHCQKAIEEITSARDVYQRHLDLLRALQPESWNRSNLDAELDRAIGAIEDAEDEFNKTSRRLASTLPGEAGALETASSSDALPKDFQSWLRAGFAFTLPVTSLLVLWIIISKIFH